MNQFGKIRWGIIGLGKIARQFANDLRYSQASVLQAAGSRDIQKAEEFGALYNAEKAYGSYKLLLEDPDVDVVYIATPHSLHYPLILASLESGKSVLCEKPLSMNAAQVKVILEKQKETGLFVMEALWTRFIPAYQGVKAWIQENSATVLSLNADFAFESEYNPVHRLYNPELGGGSLLDIGIYPVFLASDLMGIPSKISASGYIDRGIDLRMSALFEYPEGKSAMLYSDIKCQTRMDALIRTDKGTIVIPERWHNPDRFYVKNGDQTTLYSYPRTGKGYYHEIIHVEHCIREGSGQSPVYPLSDTLKLISLLDEIRRKIDLKYPAFTEDL